MTQDQALDQYLTLYDDFRRMVPTDPGYEIANHNLTVLWTRYRKLQGDLCPKPPRQHALGIYDDPRPAKYRGRD